MTQNEWEEAVVDYLDDWGYHPNLIEEVRLRMVRGSEQGHDGQALPPDQLNFLQDRLEEAMDGLCYCVGDLVERECSLTDDQELQAWRGLMGHLVAKRRTRQTERG